MHSIRAAILLIVLFPLCLPAQQKVKEPSTEKEFPIEQTISHGSHTATVQLTGVTVRKKFFVKVYAIGHYLQDALQHKKKDAEKIFLTDGKIKQIVMDFARDVDVDNIVSSYQDGFRTHTTAEEFKTLLPLIDVFLKYFTNDIKENDQLILRWFPGGIVVPVIQGKEKEPITSELFARILWSIWFDDNSVVDRDDLIDRLPD